MIVVLSYFWYIWTVVRDEKYQNFEQPSPCIVDSTPYTGILTNIDSTLASPNEDEVVDAINNGKQY